MSSDGTFFLSVNRLQIGPVLISLMTLTDVGHRDISDTPNSVPSLGCLKLDALF